MAHQGVLLAQHPDIPTFKCYVLQKFESQTLIYLVLMLGHLDCDHLATIKCAHIVKYITCNIKIKCSFINVQTIQTSNIQYSNTKMAFGKEDGI